MTVLRITGPIREIRERERRLVGSLGLEHVTEERLQGWLAETFDGRLAREGGSIEHRESSGRTELVWTDLDLVAERGRLGPVPDLPILAGSLPPGPVSERLAALLGDRALLGVGHLKRRRTTWRMRDDRGKTVLRVFVESAIEFATLDAGTRKRLPAQIQVEELRGFDEAFARARAVIAQWRGVEVATTPLGADLLVLAGLRPGHDPSSLHCDLDAGLAAVEGHRRVLSALLAVIEVNLPGCAAALDPEFLHDLRVAVRRTRTLLSASEGVLSEPARADFAAEFKWFGGETSALRDLDVHLLHFEDLVARAPHAEGRELEPLRALLRGRQEAERARVASVLRSERTRDLLLRFREFIESEDESSPERANEALAYVAAERVRDAERRVLKLGRRIEAASPDAQLHELRKRAKKLRYLLEFFGGALDANASRARIAELKALQDLLGAHQDRAVQIAALGQWASELADEPVATHDAMRALARGLDSERRALRAEFAARFGAYDARRARRAFRDALDRIIAGRRHEVDRATAPHDRERP